MKRQMNNLKIGFTMLFVCSCILMVVIITGFGFADKVDGVEKKASVRKINTAEEKASNVASKGDTREQKKAKGTSKGDTLKQKAMEIYNKNKESLVLVNKKHKLSEDYDGELTEICDGRLEASERLYEALNEMIRAGGNEGYSFFIASAYRSPQRQQQLLENDVRDFMNQGMSYDKARKEAMKQTMPAGYSEHETGLALDIMTSENLVLDENQEKMAGNKWMRKNCWKYGFILRYPKDKQKITKISYEPWHFRYVGKDAAKFMHKNNLTLEEFVGMLEE